MQFLEWSVIGLRAARHVMASPEGGARVTLFPVVHLGEPRFYEELHDEAARHDLVIVEGVSSPVVNRLTRAYRWIAPERLGLVRQPRFARAGPRMIHADLAGEDFDTLWRSAPFRERAVLEYGATLAGLWLRLTATREAIGRRLSTTDLADRDMLLAWNEDRAPIFDALLGARDRVLCDTVLSLIEAEPGLGSVGVIYGAGHMGRLAHALAEVGYRPEESRWTTVFSS